METIVRFTSPTNPIDFAGVLNELAKYIEGNEPVPDHWEKSKRQQFYKNINKYLSIHACRMIAKLNEKIVE